MQYTCRAISCSPSVLLLSCIGCCLHVEYVCKNLPMQNLLQKSYLTFSSVLRWKKPLQQKSRPKSALIREHLKTDSFHITNCMVGNEGQRVSKELSLCRAQALVLHAPEILLQHQCEDMGRTNRALCSSPAHSRGASKASSGENSPLWAHSGSPVKSRTHQSEPVLFSGWLHGFWLGASWPLTASERGQSETVSAVYQTALKLTH